MQNDPDRDPGDQKIVDDKGPLKESPTKYLVSSEKSNKSLSTFDSQRTDNSKRSTEEEELRSLSTTPRYSHEDLGRIVSPPHSSDFTSTAEEEGADFDDSLSAQQVLLRTPATQYSQPLPLVITEEDLNKARRSELQLALDSEPENTQRSLVLETYRSLKSESLISQKPDTYRSQISDKPSSLISDAHRTLGSESYRFGIQSTHRSNASAGSDQGSEKGWAKPIRNPYRKVYTIPEKGSAKTVHHTVTQKDISDNISLKSHTTAPELASLKVRKDFHRKPQFTDHGFNKSLNPLREDTRKHRLATTVPHYTRTQLKNPPENQHHRFGGSTGALNYGHLQAEELLGMRMRNIDKDLNDILMDAEKVQRNLANEHDHRRLLEKQLEEVDEERKELGSKLAALRVKLGVANSNYNVSKNECDQLRKKFQEAQIQKARLEERIQTCTKDLVRLKDPNNPESNVNMKKVVLNDRKEIRRLRTDLEGVRSERSEIQKQIQDRDEKIKMLHIYIGEARDQLQECNRDLEIAKISVTGERKKREEVEAKYNELLKDKQEFDSKMAEIQGQLDVAVNGTSGIHQISEQFRDKEQTLLNKIENVERKLRDVLTQIEQQKNRNMPVRTASSIKHHQYRMFRGSLVTDTTPHVFVVTDPNASLASSGYLGKTVVSTKPVKSLPGKSEQKLAPKSKGGSLPAKK